MIQSTVYGFLDEITVYGFLNKISIQAGLMWKTAAAKHGASESTISRAIKREASRCPMCGQVVKESKHVADD